MNDRLARRFARLKFSGRTGLVAFLVAGEPRPDDTVETWLKLVRAGADLIEIGLPAEAWLDGPAIRAAHNRAKSRGIDTAAALAAVREFRRHDEVTPLVLMGYGETLRKYGVELLAADAAAAGADALLFVGAADAELAELDSGAAQHGLATIRIIAGNDEQQWREQLAGARGFAYVVAALGATGGTPPKPVEVAARLVRLRRLADVPLVAGFGVRNAATFRALAGHADAVAVGTAFAEIIDASLDQSDLDVVARLCDFARELADAGHVRRAVEPS